MGVKGVWIIDRLQEVETCQDCRHFVQHYVKDYCGYRDYVECFAGHCVYPRMKDKKQRTKACKYFEQGNYDEEKRS